MLADGEPCVIGSRALDVLTALVERRDRVVSKNELLELAWPGLMVEENNLSVQISALRKLLGPETIATVTGRGYQFVRTCDAEPDRADLYSAIQTERVPRRLLALVCAELHPCGENGSAHAWRQSRGPLIEASLAAFAGEAIEITAERTLLVFASAVDAVAWSVDLQERLAHASDRVPSMALPMRVVVTAQEVVFDKGKLVGDPFAASEPARRSAPAGEVCVTSAVRSLVGNRIAADFVEIEGTAAMGPGPQLWRVRRRALDPSQAEPSPRLLWNHRPTVAVLPFDCGGEPGDTYFGDGITEEIITALSMNRAFLVVARDSSLRFRDPSGSTVRAAVELGVRYVITGTVRRFDRRLRIHVKLTDAEADRIIWSERFDGNDEDLFLFQSQIASRTSAAIDPRVHEAELARVHLKPTEHFGAYDCVLRGLSLLFDVGTGDFETAGDYFRRAIELDPAYAQAHGHLARWHSLRAGDGRVVSPTADREAAEFHSQRAIALDPRDAWNLAIAGHIQSFLRKRFGVAMELFDQALGINPNCALAWARSGTTLAYLGRGEEALERVRNAMRLSPFDQHAFYFNTTNGIASIVLGRYDEAVVWLSRARRLNPRYRASVRMLIAAHSLAGEATEARELATAFLAEEPSFRTSSFAQWYPLQMPHLARVLDGLHASGLPD